MLEHSPGEAACSNIERYIDSSARRGVKRARVGGRVHHPIEGGGGGRQKQGLTFTGVRAVSDVELGPYFFFGSEYKLAGTDLWTL
jgi:hypothetical protein